MLFIEIYFRYNVTEKLKGLKKIHHALLIPDNITRNKETHFIIIKESTHQENIQS